MQTVTSAENGGTERTDFQVPTEVRLRLDKDIFEGHLSQTINNFVKQTDQEKIHFLLMAKAFLLKIN